MAVGLRTSVIALQKPWETPRERIFVSANRCSRITQGAFMARQMLSTHAAELAARVVRPSAGHPRVRAGIFSFFSLAVMLALNFSASTLEAALPRGISGDRAADLILGKPDF